MPRILWSRKVLRWLLIAFITSAAVNLLLVVCNLRQHWLADGPLALPSFHEFHFHLRSTKEPHQKGLSKDIAPSHKYPKSKSPKSISSLLSLLDISETPIGLFHNVSKLLKFSNSTKTTFLHTIRNQDLALKFPSSTSSSTLKSLHPLIKLQNLTQTIVKQSFMPRSIPVPHQLSAIPVPVIYRSKSINCAAVIGGVKNEIHKAVISTYIGGCYPDPANVSYFVPNCTSFVDEKGFVTAASEEELAFPIAYSILLYRNLCQFERFLRTIWRPQNLYCVHVDASSPHAIHSSVRAIASCFANVFLASRQVDVVWGRTVLDADLQCMDDLLQRRNVYGAEWKYFVNTNAHEFPLRTNLELVRVLQTLNGANSVNRAADEQQHFLGTIRAPLGVRLWKGETHILACRGFVRYMRRDPLALNLTEFVRKRAFNPGETLYSTLNFNSRVLQTPGAFTGNLNLTHLEYGYFHRYKHWMMPPRIAQGTFDRVTECGGKWYYLCLYGVADLPRLTDLRRVVALFANKLYWHFQPHALDCLEEWHANRTQDELNGRLWPIDLTYYRGIVSVFNHSPCYPFQ